MNHWYSGYCNINVNWWLDKIEWMLNGLSNNNFEEQMWKNEQLLENTINIKVVVNNIYYNIYIDRFHDFSLDHEIDR